MSSYIKYQNDLFMTVLAALPQHISGEALKKAFFKMPRHLFIKKYRIWGEDNFSNINEDNIDQHLSRIYTDNSLIVAGDKAYEAISSNSQPSFILKLVSMLGIEEGQNVLEIGSGTGWLGAIISDMIGDTGHYTGIEIIDEVASQSIITLEQLNINNATILSMDGSSGYHDNSPYDRVIFTAGSYLFPEFLFDQVVDGGKVIIPIKNKGVSDNIFLLKKVGDIFVSEASIPGAFVPMAGVLRSEETNNVLLSDIKFSNEVSNLPSTTKPFWWGSENTDLFFEKTVGFRSFLNTYDSRYKSIRINQDDDFRRIGFGLVDATKQFIVFWHQDKISMYGNLAEADAAIKELMSEWVALGLPNASCLNLTISKMHAWDKDLHPGRWHQERDGVLFSWEIKTGKT